jgi:uncharacterized protein YijF (DUF1287 family)
MSRSTARLLVCLGITLAGVAVASAGPREERGRSNLGAAESATPGDFASSLAAAARRQVSFFVFYNSSYQKIPYPMGDVPSYFGVCTDVVVRAYRALGIDLQVQVQKAGVGTGDTNIDHRRVEVLRKFFARAGTSLPITKNPDDYKVGDIVTYYMPNGWLSKTHIAIVGAERTSPVCRWSFTTAAGACRRKTGCSPRRSRATSATAVRADPHSSRCHDIS